MKFLFYTILKQISELLFRLHIIGEERYKKLLKPYYREKITLFSIWHNFLCRRKVIGYFNLHVTNAKMVVYTCLTGGYDALLTPDYMNPECDYVCFTDDEEMIKRRYIGPWKIEPLRFSELNNSKNNRWHKMHPHILFPNYSASLYIDSNVNFKTGKIFEYIRSVPHKCFLALPRHSKRDCIYDEADFVVASKIDSIENVAPLMDKYRQENFPEHFGLAENNVIFRRHNNKECIKLMEEWWSIFNQYSRRDQLSLFYLLWKNKIDYVFFSPYSFKKDHKNFKIYKHKG